MSFRNEPAPHYEAHCSTSACRLPGRSREPPLRGTCKSIRRGFTAATATSTPIPMNSERQTSFVPVVVLAQWGWGGRGGGGAFRVRDTRADRGWRCGCASDRNALRISTVAPSRPNLVASVLNYNRGIARRCLSRTRGAGQGTPAVPRAAQAATRPHAAPWR